MTEKATPGEAIDRLITNLFALGDVGYVAVGREQDVTLREAPGLTTNTTSESNFYEELLVNPTLLKLARQRGELDCGGLGYVAIGYGAFMQVIVPTADGGHVSLGVSRKTVPSEFVARVRGVLGSLALPA